MSKGAILVVEDTLASLKLLVDMLTAEGYQVRPADSGELALESVAADPPELILLDIRMPGMDGFEVMRRLKAWDESRNIPVMFLSAATETELRLEGLRLGAVDYVSKPFQREELLTRVATHLGLSQLRARLERQAAELRLATEQFQLEMTERKRSEAALQKSKLDLTAIIDNLPFLAWLKDREGRFLAVNEPFARSCGFPSANDLVGKTDLDIWPKQLAEAYRADDFEVMRTRQKKAVEERIADKGEEKWFDTYKAPLYDADGNVTGTTGFARDITESKRAQQALRESERRLQAILDQALALVYVLDLEGRFTLVNQRLAALFGQPGTAILGKTREAFLPKNIADQHLANDLEVVRTGKPIIIEESNDQLDGRHTYLSVRFPLRDETGAITAVCGISTDITERKQAEREVRELNEQLEARVRQRTAEVVASNKQLEEFAYVASHDLQEPLRMVTSYVQLIEERLADKLDADTRKFMGFAVEGASRMQHMVRDILTYSRVNTLGAALTPVDIAAALKEALTLLAGRIAETGAKVEAQALPVVMADRTQLVQLFQNLIGNAIKFCRDRPPHVCIEARREGQWWRFSVTDNGIGIAAEYRAQLFVIFKRLHTRREYPGTGIGLAICKRIVERHGGEIGIEPAPDGGSTFWFTLPEEQSP